MTRLLNKPFFKGYPYNKKSYQRKLFNYFYKLDCNSGEGIVNPLLIKLEKISSAEFKNSLHFILKKCINVNRSFSDAIKFLSIWLKKSPYTLLIKLKQEELKTFFNQTEYHYDGNQWHFPQLLQIFLVLISKVETADNILAYLFKNFDFMNIPDDFIRSVIGYDRLEACVREIPKIFTRPLLIEMQKIIREHENKGEYIDIGHASYAYLKKELAAPQKKSAITTANTTLISHGFFQASVPDTRYCKSKTHNRLFIESHLGA
jgi:hypothetical protein